MLLFQRPHEPFRTSVVVGISTATHADLDTVPFQQPGVIRGCILDPAIGVVDQPFGFPASLGKRHTQCSKRQLRFQATPQVPADDLARVSIQNHCQVDKFIAQTNEGDVGYPQLVRRRQLHMPRQVRVDRQEMGVRRWGSDETTSHLMLVKIRDYFVWPASSRARILKRTGGFDLVARFKDLTGVALERWIAVLFCIIAYYSTYGGENGTFI